MFLETTKTTGESTKTVELFEKPLFVQDDDTASREYSSEDKEVVPIPVSSEKDASTLSGETLKSPQH